LEAFALTDLPRQDRNPNRPVTVLVAAAAILALKVLVTIVWEYQRYFPADFESAFLSGKRAFFHGGYRFAFYAHILVGPATIVLAAILLHSGFRQSYQYLHRSVGRIQAAFVLLVLVPSGLVMSVKAYAGPIASAGFATLSLATAVTMVLAIDRARRGLLLSHRRWAVRTAILLTSPLFSRVIAGAAITMNLETETFYWINAWVSWLVPLVGYEMLLQFRSGYRFGSPRLVSSSERALS
jgi:hypothetical protein